MRIGQPVEISADLYGSDVKYSGTVDSLGAGTGSAFALLPAQNATGNWIKIVQRVPVRIHLNPEQLKDHPCVLACPPLSRSICMTRAARRWPSSRHSKPATPPRCTIASWSKPTT